MYWALITESLAYQEIKVMTGSSQKKTKSLKTCLLFTNTISFGKDLFEKLYYFIHVWILFSSKPVCMWGKTKQVLTMARTQTQEMESIAGSVNINS